MQTKLALALLILPATALTGCTGVAGDPFVPAMEHVEIAREEARAWSANATLAQAQAIDPAQAPPNGSVDDALPLAWRLDPTLGDGRSQAWGYHFTAPDRGNGYDVVVAGNGTIRQAGEQAPASEGAYELEANTAPIEGWEVDSDAAAERLADANATWLTLRSEPSTLVTFTQLWGAEHGNPFWLFGAETTEDGGREHTYFVDATTGAYLGTTPPGNRSLYDLQPREGPPPEGGRFNGTVSPVEPEQTHSFDVEREGHPYLTVELSVDGTGAGTVNATMLDPAGEVRGSIEAGEGGGSQGVSAAIEAPSTGAWTVEVVLEDGALQRYQLDWCAADRPADTMTPSMPPSEEAPCAGASQR